MGSRLIVDLPSYNWIPDIQIYEDDIKKLEIPPLKLRMPDTKIISLNNSYIFCGETNTGLVSEREIPVEMKVKDSTISIVTKDNIVEKKFDAQMLFESLLMKFSKEHQSLFETEYGIKVLREMNDEYIQNAFHKDGTLYLGFIADGIGIVESSGCPLMVTRKIVFGYDRKIILNDTIGKVKLDKIISPSIKFLLDDGKMMIISNISGITTAQDSNVSSMNGVVTVFDDYGDTKIPLDTSLEGEEFEESVFKYLSSQKKNKASFDDLMLD